MSQLGKFLAFDVGGTTIKCGVINQNLELSGEEKFATNNNCNQHILKIIKTVSQQKMSQTKIDGIGISTGGIVNPADGSISYAGPTIPNYTGTPLKAEVEKTTGLKVNVVNDVDAALLGELLHGAVTDAASVYCIALGTGIGGAFYTHGKLYGGANNQANSVGYMMYNRNSNTNFETRTSTLALERELTEKFNLSPKEAFDVGAKHPTGKVQRTINRWIDQLGANIANIILILDPEVFLIGGAVSAQENRIRKALEAAISCYLPSHFMKTQIRFASLRNRAALYGAIYPFIQGGIK